MVTIAVVPMRRNTAGRCHVEDRLLLWARTRSLTSLSRGRSG